MKLPKLVALSLLLLPCFCPFVEARDANQSKSWESKAMIDIMQLKIAEDSKLEKMASETLLDGELLSALASRQGDKALLKDIEKAVRNGREFLEEQDLRLIKLRYRLVPALINTGKLKRARTILRRNLVLEIERESLIETKWRKRLGKKEIANEKMETEEQFKQRQKILIKQTRKDLPKAILYRLVRLHFTDRKAEAVRLAKVGLKLFDLEKVDKRVVDSIKFWGAVSSSNLSKPVNLENQSLNNILLARQKLFENKANEAIADLSSLKISDTKSGEKNFAVDRYLLFLKAKAFFKAHNYKATRETLVEICDKAIKRRRGYFDSFISRPLMLNALDMYIELANRQFFPLYDKSNGLNGNKLAKFNFAIPEAVLSAFSFAEKSKQVKSSKKKNIELTSQEKFRLKLIAFDYYFIGYKYKLTGEQFKAQQFISLAINIFQKYFAKEPKLVDGCLYDLGESYSWSSNYDLASVFLDQCLQIRNRVGRNTDSKVMTMDLLGRSLISAGEVENGKQVLNRALAYRIEEIYKNSNKTKTDAKSSAFDRGKFESASFTKRLIEVKKAYKVADSGMKKKLRISMQYWIDSFISSRHYDEALEIANLLIAYRGDEKSDLPIDLTSNRWQLAFISSSCGDMEASQSHYSLLLEGNRDKRLRDKAHWYYSRGLGI